MANTAAQTANNAEADQTNDPGYCLQQCRIWAGINSMYPDAATAWRNTNDRHPGNKDAPRGSAVYWTGGSHGYGHIAISLGGGNVRSTDAGGSGIVATRNIDWFTANWGLPYAGWAWDINEATIVHDQPEPEPKPPEEDMPKYVRVKRATDQKIAAPQGNDDGWVNIVWESSPSGSDDIFKKDEAYLLLKDKMFTGALSLTATVDPSIDVIRTRFIEREQNDKGEWETQDTYPALESKNTSGNTYVVDTRVQKCNSKRLVAQVNLGSKGGTLLGAELNLLYF